MEEKNELIDEQAKLAAKLTDMVNEYIQTFGTDVTHTDDVIVNLEHKIFYLLHSRERIEEHTFKGNDAKEWVAKYGPEANVFKESEVLNFIKKHKIK
jgi:hypothetical protein